MAKAATVFCFSFLLASDFWILDSAFNKSGVEKMYCPKCGTQNIEDARFCRGCGADIALVPQAMTGGLPDARSEKTHGAVGVVFDPAGRRHRRRDSPPRLDKAIGNIFMGIGFLVAAISVLLVVPGGRSWWFAFLFPAFGLLGGGVSEYVRYKQSRGEEIKLPGIESKTSMPPPARVSALPPRDTSELVPPPPSVTEGTTRHLDLSREAPPRQSGAPVENQRK